VKDIRLKPVLIITRIPTPLQGKSCRYESIRCCFNRRQQENLADNKMQTHFDFFISPKISILKILHQNMVGTADAGEHIDGMDSTTGLPIISLYGNKKPTLGQLKELTSWF
jgi:uncharacterized protein YbbC (DUF1343 family)